MVAMAMNENPGDLNSRRTAYRRSKSRFSIMVHSRFSWTYCGEIDFYQRATRRKDHLHRGSRGLARLVLRAEELGVARHHAGVVRCARVEAVSQATSDARALSRRRSTSALPASR